MEQNDNNRKIKNYSTAAAITSGVATGVGLGVASYKQQQEPLDSENYQHLLQRDQPIDQIPLVGMHNAGTEAGSGTWFFSANQNMGIKEVLETTPVRAIALDVHEHDGEFVINHGGMYDPTVENPKSFQETLNEINQFLQENPNEVVIIDVEYGFGQVGDRSAEDWEKIRETNQILEDTFGTKIWTPEEQQIFYDDNGRWPTMDEMTSGGDQVILSSYYGGNTTPTAGAEMFATGSTITGHESWLGGVYEDRNVYSIPGRALTSEVADTISTHDVDQRVANNEGGIMWLDKITQDDPRFLLPEDRSQLALRPDMTVGNDLFYVNDDTVNNVAFGTGAGLATTTGGLSLATGLYQNAQTNQYIKEIRNGKNVSSLLNTLDASDFGNRRDISRDDVKKHVKDKLKSNVTKNTVTTNMFATVGVSTALLSMSLLFPPAFGALAISSLAVLGVGTLATGIGALVNRKRSSNAVDQAFGEQQSLNKTLDIKVDDINSGKENLLSKDQKNMDKSLQQATTGLIGLSLLTRLSGMAKYAMPAIGTVAGFVGGGVIALSSAVSAVSNYRNRNKAFKDPEQGINRFIRSYIDKKPAIGGSSYFDNYLKRNQEVLKNELGLSQKATFREVKDTINQSDNAAILNTYRSQALKENLSKKYHEFKQKGNHNKSFDQFIQKEIKQSVRKDVRRSGIWNSGKIATAIGSSALFFPPAAGIIMAVAAGGFLLGSAISLITAEAEASKISKKVQTFIQNSHQETGQKQISKPSLLNELKQSIEPLIPDASHSRYHSSKIQKQKEIEAHNMNNEMKIQRG